MIREKTAPSGPRPDFSSSKSHENYDPTQRPRAGSTRDTATLNTGPRNTHSLFSFGGIDDNTNGSFDFLPSPSFDDLQSSISTSSNDLQNQFPAPGGTGKVIADKRSVAAMDTSINEGRGATAAARTSSGPRPIRSGSIVRRQSTSTRQSSVSSTTSGASGAMDPPSAPLAMRNRRPNQYPPVSGSGTANGPLKGPRRSIGAGSIDADFPRAAATQRRRPSLASNSSAQGLSDSAVSTRLNIGNGGKYTEGARGLTASRAAKTKSLQPPATQGQALLTVSTPEQSRPSSFASRHSAQRVNTPSSSAKRMSVMHGQGAHASGLGARTVSPTDARRAKRLSVLQNTPSLKNAPPMPNTPPTPQADASVIRTSSRSPSVLPRKTPTPSSISLPFGSRLSTGSTASFNAARTFTGSLQPRVPPPPPSSRLPAPKTRSVHSSAGNNDEEDVPPVPAIPRAYESPKESPSEPPLFTHRKSSLPFDTSSINSTSTNSLSGRGSAREPLKSDRDPKHRHHVPLGSNSDVDQQNNATPVKKNLQPLRLPPLNLLPLSTPTAAKIAALPASTEGKSTPPPRRGAPTTPSTPMTASKASFFSRNRHDEKAEIDSHHMRSSSSVHNLRSESPSQFDASGSESSKPIPIPNRAARQAVSPFVSSSLPKNGGEHSYMPRSKTSGDFTTMDTSLENRGARVNGPRAQKLTKTQKIDTPPEISSPDEPPTTPSSNSSLRRKLSLSWKRNTSKNNLSISHAANERDSEYAPPPPKHDSMPPPKIPASATINNLSSFTVPSPSPSVKSATYLDSKRRKSSASSLTLVNGHDRTRSDSWGLHSSPKKDHPEAKQEKNPPTARTTSSTLQKMLGSKPSMNTMSTTRTSRPWTTDLDKDDLMAEDEMKRLGSKRKETETAAKQLDALRKRATPKERVSPQQALQMASLNIYERGEIVDYKDIYFCGTSNATKHVGELTATAVNFGFDDERGDYSIVFGDHLLYRYEVIDVLGKGSFGQVVRCIDHKTGGLVAIKIIRNKKRFHQQALVEVNILKKLREWDPNNKHSMVNFTQSFYFRGHLCISTELLDMNLYEFIKSNAFRGFSLKIVRRFTKQLLSSLVLLKQHKVIHCDLKPENVLLAHPLHSEIKVIDFGSSCFEHEKVYTYIQSRFYRSPEVILGMTYGLPIDMWSLGCILAELFTGVPIFPGENEQEQLACIMEVFGPPEKHLIEKSSRKKLFFDSLGKPRLTVSSKGRRRRPSSKSLQQVLKCDDDPFLDFLTRCMRWDPDRRMKPEEAARHEFVTGQKSSMAPVRVHYPRTESPTKRHRAIATPSSTNRPLPEPPVTSFKNGTAVRTREAAGTSPIKNPPMTARRTSNINGLSSTIGSRRISTGPGVPLGQGTSGLPRVTRSVSAKQEMASAGATAAMGRRA